MTMTLICLYWAICTAIHESDPNFPAPSPVLAAGVIALLLAQAIAPDNDGIFDQ